MLEPQFFAHRSTLEVAQRLLGMELVHDSPEGTTAGIIVEVEAYMGPHDKGAHTYGGKVTPRTRAMYGPPGHAYIYLIYGMHHCLNVVSAPVGAPEAVLIRALEPTRGIELMARRRGLDLPPPDGEGYPVRWLKKLASGPGKLCQAMGINMEHYGLSLMEPPLYLRHARDPIPTSRVATGPRINIPYAEEFRDKPWRFWIRDNPHVSQSKRPTG